MEKKHWPQAWKDQYNREIDKRNVKAYRRESEDNGLFPRIWEFPVTEETVFSLLAYLFPFNHLIVRILREAIPSDFKGELLLRRKVYCKNLFPGYYSDHERLVIVMNRYREDHDVEDVINWLGYYGKEETPSRYWNLIIGLIFLDLYLKDLRQGNLLTRAIKHLGMVDAWVENEDSKYATGSLLAFCYYMNQDFDESLICLKTSEPLAFHHNFGNLIKKIA